MGVLKVEARGAPGATGSPRQDGAWKGGAGAAITAWTAASRPRRFPFLL